MFNLRKKQLISYFLIAVLVKGFFFGLFAFLFNQNPDKTQNIHFIFTVSRDFRSYIDPSVNLVEKGEYFEQEKEKKLLAHKMPGMVPIFVPLYFLLGFEWGLVGLVTIQFIVDCICCVLLGIIALRLFQSERAFKVAFWLYTLSTIVSIGTHHAVSELFCTSFSVIALYYWLIKQHWSHFLLSGFFAAWAIFFRPTAILLLLFIPLIGLVTKEGRINFFSVRKLFPKLLIFLLPFIVFDSIWIIRNYVRMNRFVPADMVIENFGTPGMKSIFRFVSAIGGDLQSWNPDSEMRWFNMPGSMNYDSLYAASDPFPSYVYKSGIKMQEIRKLRDIYYAYQKSENRDSVFKLETELSKRSSSLIKQFKSKNAFAYYITAPLRIAVTLVFIKRPYGFSFTQHGLLQRGLRAWHFIFYYIPVLLLVGVLVFRLYRDYPALVWIFVLILLHIILYACILRTSENRYLVPIYPFFILFGSALILKTGSRIPSIK